MSNISQAPIPPAAATATATQAANAANEAKLMVLGDLNGVLMDIQCGKYSELCCLANPQIMGTFLAWRAQFGLAKTIELIHYVCNCTVATPPTTGGSGGNPPAAQV